jgi:hypothetical protein
MQLSPPHFLVAHAYNFLSLRLVREREKEKEIKRERQREREREKEGGREGGREKERCRIGLLYLYF